MSCALRQVLCQRFDEPEYQPVFRDLINRYKHNTRSFSYLIPSLELSLPRDLGFDLPEVRRTCDICALNPLDECKLGDLILCLLQERSTEERRN